ncbi:hypothetical protein [Legionella pneumophila]|uniref:hypothetical protein n=1 Tax=Legionella pneumophila TaxID=446 RepID=UPI000770B24C|nr:hypothetical protein [Legionella pneumophila]AOU05316.1 hypothetical protein A9E97_11625 [Legionella pneumophila]AOU29122.1 hypothetical protein A9E78_11635 [Legionella pneumophila]AOU32102.1 hypothetical protein A9E79_11820 [Legionella pneumophila]AOU35068.1 hypothetical protein A9E80_11640 [Legionella pneumophila]AOU38029.1 hypothetical protein A9E81_11645 [Legionella pneumophila]
MQEITLKLNVLGFLLNENDISPLLDLDNHLYDFQRNWICAFFNLESTELYSALLQRYVTACTIMTNISAGSNQENIHTKLISTLSSAKKTFSYGEYLACIELCALHGEMLANYLCITSSNELINHIDSMQPEDQKKIRKIEENKLIYIANSLDQSLRIRWLENAKVISKTDKKNLIDVHRLRTSYFHRWSTKTHNQEKDALKSLEQISNVSAKFLELLGSGSNVNVHNVQRVKQYMQIVIHPNQTITIPKKRNKIYKLVISFLTLIKNKIF